MWHCFANRLGGTPFLGLKGFKIRRLYIHIYIYTYIKPSTLKPINPKPYGDSVARPIGSIVVPFLLDLPVFGS